MIHESKHARHNQYIYLKFVLLGHLIIYFLKMRVYEHTYIHTHIYVYATIYIYIHIPHTHMCIHMCTHIQRFLAQTT